MPTKFDPRDIRVMITHAAPTSVGGPSRTVGLEIEHAATGTPIVRATMTPVQFAAVMASSATVVPSEIDPPAPGRTPNLDEWHRPGDRVVHRAGGKVLTVDDVQPIIGAEDRQQFRATEDTMWHHSDQYQVVPPQPTSPWLNVTLTWTTNMYLTVPCQGQVRVTEYGTDGSVIHAVFRQRNDDGTYSPAVEVDSPEWIYRGRTNPRTQVCPNPAAHAGEDSDAVSDAARVADAWRDDSDPIIRRLVAQIDALVGEARRV
jgi:hypothetical protein